MEAQREITPFRALLLQRKLHSVFQPIVSITDRQVLGLEAFIRGPRGHPLEHPAELFGAAEREGLGSELELMARSTTLLCFAELGFPGKLFLNINPACLMRQGFALDDLLFSLSEQDISPRQVVLELTEHQPIEDFSALAAAVNSVRQQGLMIAIDDLGAGHASMRLLCELKPDFLKIDKYFSQGIEQEAVKRKVVRGILGMARAVGAQVVAEGVETLEQLRVLMDMGVDHVQGFLLARPEREPVLEKLKGFAWPEPLNLQSSRELTFGSAALLLQQVPTFPGEMRASELLDYLGRDENLPTALPVLRGEQPLGLISRADFQERMSRLYARELLGRKTLENFVASDSLIVDKHESLDMISHELTRRHESSSSRYPLDHFLITSQGRYAGVGSTRNLLRKITEAQMDLARHANPLSGLPGNIPIQRRLSDQLAQQVDFTVGYCDIDQFKPFNDVYGYARGDELLRELARILIRVTGIDVSALHQDTLDNFVGHIGGDDFVLILSGLKYEALWDEILDRFARMAPSLYDPVDREVGGITSVDRRGIVQFFPIASLSIGVVPCPVGRFSHPQEISQAASMVKSQAKKLPGNCYFMDRRAP